MGLSESILYRAFGMEPGYSQTGEDKILKHLFDGMGHSKISYLDIGANHPIRNNNTYLFYKNGSRGVCVEPNPELCRLIRRKRPGDKCLNAGVSINSERSSKFYLMVAHTLSTFSKEEALNLEKAGHSRIKKILEIPLLNINDIIRENFSDRIDLVSIDVESWNTEIIQSIDFSLVRPFCFCVETLVYSTNNQAAKLGAIGEIFKQQGYREYADTRFNTIFVDNASLPE